MTPRFPVSEAPVTRIFTTAGLTVDATAIVADDSSMATGWTAPAFDACGKTAAGAGRSRAPAAFRASTVPPDARTADRSVAATSDPLPRPSRRVAVVAGAVGAGVGAGSYQRSGVTGGASSQDLAHSERVSGVDVYRSPADAAIVGPGLDAPLSEVTGVTGSAGFVAAWRWVSSDGSVASGRGSSCIGEKVPRIGVDR